MTDETNSPNHLWKLRFKLRNETPGAIRYEELDASGNVISIANGAKIGTLYIRKSGTKGGKVPKFINGHFDAEY